MDDPWPRFALDPRDPTHAVLRAADADREVVAGVLHEAYAEGRLDRAELDERTDTLQATKTLGELPALLADLVPARLPTPTPPISSGTLVAATPSDLEQMARDEYASDRRAAVFTFLSVSALVWVIWAVTGAGWPWPAIPSVVLFLRAAEVVAKRDERIRDELKRLEKKQRRQLKPPEQPMGDV